VDEGIYLVQSKRPEKQQRKKVCLGVPSITIISSFTAVESQEIKLTLTLESPPPVANLYCLPPAMIGPELELLLEATLEESSSSANRRLSWARGSGWKSQE